jgi:solute:Na+ symporter, SSS family
MVNIPLVLADGALSGHFTYLDWLVVFGYLVFTTLLGGLLAGKQQNIKDFFLAGRKLPWYAVAGSVIATEISAITFVSVPFVIFQPGGNFTYLQLGLIGALLARIIVGYVLVPAYYKREIYSPYDYMGNQLGPKVRSMTTALFSLGGMLAQSARVYLTAIILALILHEPLSSLEAVTGIPPLVSAIIIICAVAIGWTLMGGMATVIWTDVILFFVFLIGGVAALITIANHVPGGFAEVMSLGIEAGKFQLWDFNPSPTLQFTIWTAAIAATWGGVGAYGTDQLMAQRLFCCKNEADARKAVIASWIGVVITIMVLFVGVGLYAYYHHFPLTGEALAAYTEKGDRIFPIFIITVIPQGVTGLIIAGIFAAAISSLDSILAALSQTSMSAFYLPWRQRKLERLGLALPKVRDPVTGRDAPEATSAAEDRHTVFASRMIVIFWGVVLCLMAYVAHLAAQHYEHLLGLALSMAGYVSGGLMAGFFLAFFAKRLDINGRGFLWAAPIGVLAVVSIAWFQTWAYWTVWLGAIALLVIWVITVAKLPANHQKVYWPKTLYLGAALGILLLLKHYGYVGEIDPEIGTVAGSQRIAWPWYAPLGSTMTFVFGYLLAGPRHLRPAEEIEEEEHHARQT